MAKKLRSTTQGNPAKKSDPRVELVVASVQFALLVIGIIGIASAIFRKGGLLERMGGSLMRMEFASLLIVIPLILVAVFVGRYWFEIHFSKSSSTAIAELAMYSVMAIGAYYLINYFFPIF